MAGVASSEAPDSDGETVSADAMRQALPGYMTFGNIREMHSESAAGICVSADVCVDGKTRINTLIVDPIAIKKVTTGVYKGFSIGGETLSRQGKTITRLKLNEISLVDRPANPEAKMDLWKAETTKITMLDSKFFAKALGLLETATETDIADALAKLKPTTPPAQTSTPDISAIVEAVKKAVANPDLNTTIEKLNRSVESLTTRAAQSDALIQKAERQSILDQANREGKVIPLEDDEVFGNLEKKIEAVPLQFLRSMLAKAQKTVPMKARSIVPLNVDGKETPVMIDTDKLTKLEKKDRASLVSSAQTRGAASIVEHIRKSSQN